VTETHEDENEAPHSVGNGHTEANLWHSVDSYCVHIDPSVD